MLPEEPKPIPIRSFRSNQVSRISMRTFTFRIPASLTERLNSREMRSWLREFLCQPRPLPPDPGTGDHRISLTLPTDQVQQLAGMLGCTPSSALRRLAVGELGFVSKTAPSPSLGVARAAERGVTTSLEKLVEKQRRIAALQNHPQAPMTEKNSGGLGFLFAGAIAFLAFLFFGFGPGNAPE